VEFGGTKLYQMRKQIDGAPRIGLTGEEITDALHVDLRSPPQSGKVQRRGKHYQAEEKTDLHVRNLDEKLERRRRPSDLLKDLLSDARGDSFLERVIDVASLENSRSGQSARAVEGRARRQASRTIIV
jgi:hypothetical protein